MSKRILVVENQPDNREIIRDIPSASRSLSNAKKAAKFESDHCFGKAPR
jgi:hypothetical protein